MIATTIHSSIYTLPSVHRLVLDSPPISNRRCVRGPRTCPLFFGGVGCCVARQVAEALDAKTADVVLVGGGLWDALHGGGDLKGD